VAITTKPTEKVSKDKTRLYFKLNMKRLALAALAGLLLWNCSRNDVKPNSPIQSTAIVGVWKLIQVRPPWYGELTDYSNNNIRFDFRSNGKLIITGAPSDVYPNGEYSYFFGLDYFDLLHEPSEPKTLLVKFNNLKWGYQLTDGKMTLGQSYSDGSDFIFVRCEPQ
jgi:hypothetical protein